MIQPEVLRPLSVVHRQRGTAVKILNLQIYHHLEISIMSDPNDYQQHHDCYGHIDQQGCHGNHDD